ncbi:MAG: FKBP-type peptidyl-prolyl cis-trans isomerase [Lachnospiraceae bacterium]|nr:FKBP-type peptidyl-prolyl cis-trans isomerase [Lachnospiraceae bacterium]
MSKKENKEMAKERRAKERERQDRLRVTRNVIIVLVVIAAIVAVAAAVIMGDNAKQEAEQQAQAERAESSSMYDVTPSASPSLDTTAGLEAKDGDTVNIDYTGYVKETGEAFEGGSTQGSGADLTLGSGQYIPGFEEGVVGHKVGDTFDVPMTFPEDYWNTDLAGKEVYFTITLNGIYK